jgi:diaminohydroxyphosphoribosylaminopyrimidine deaminase/5-amino-6-(5-phosphoribosylamino)uracil reductase
MKAGVRVVQGVLKRKCDQLNKDYFHWTRTQQPWVILKLAMTLDGSLAVPGRRWITGAEARAEVQKIRAGCDAILVGAETVRKDNPRLTVRIGTGRPQPWRAVVTKSEKLPGQAEIFSDAYRDRTVIYPNRPWESVLKDLYQRGVRRLLVEGGAKTAAGLIAAGKVNDVVLFFAPQIAEQGHPRVADWAGWKWSAVSVTGAGRDLCLRGTLKGAK